MEWTHYSRVALPLAPEPTTGIEYGIKPRGMYFAPGTAWRDFAVEWLATFDYAHKYRLTNLAALKLLVINAAYVAQPRVDIARHYSLDFCAISAEYDGVLIMRDEIRALCRDAEPDTRLGRWYVFASGREHDELIVWRNQTLEEVAFDWPRRNPYRLVRANEVCRCSDE